ncbi:MAG: pectinesterase [Chitinophagaceae bacterium]|nr:pectinesterase [Chitinophagaceae bacterium]
MKKILTILSALLLITNLPAQINIIVSADGNGCYKTIQEAINSLPDSATIPSTISIKNGIYKEKLFVKKSNIVFEGESREKTVITFSIARDEWRCDHADDWGVATLNVGANDITLKNLTVINSFGFDYKNEYTVDCASDSSKKKTINIRSHQMALRTMSCTRLKAMNCHFKAFGGDTVSPWETENGMWYFKDCVMEGGVDFYCPRGWAWAENCEFITHTGTAAIWHDGSVNPDSKTVLVNCSFKGFDGFSLGRYHRDAQFYLVNCVLPKNMKDAPIYLVPTGNIIKWGERIYYYNCRREGGKEYKWYSNNLPLGLQVNEITVNWVFGNRWKL